jgi:hypothetical protein
LFLHETYAATGEAEYGENGEGKVGVTAGAQFIEGFLEYAS